MANPEHVEIVLSGPQSIKSWQAEHPEDTLDLSNARLKYVNLEWITLQKADFRNAYIEHAHFYNCQITKSNFEGATFDKANFGNADLMQVIFRKAQMKNVSFTSSSVVGTIFTDAKLINASFLSTSLRFCSLMGADLRNAEFSFTGLHDSSLNGANLNNAKLNDTTWNDINLSDIKGLETIQHSGPSSLGIDTLEKSKGKIPEIFFRGCGLSDDLITLIKTSFPASDHEFYSCFISYSHADKTFAKRLHDALQNRGIRCWLDEDQILPGDNIYERIDHGIRVWDKVLLCASKQSLTSPWVDDEVTHVFAKEKDLSRERGYKVQALIPLNLDGYIFKHWNHPKKNQILERMAADFTDWEEDNTNYEQQLERVVKALQTNNTAREPDPKPKL
ncbi:toll/interleukin-1 receptor domain-containing protein [Gimesia maris]|uniref:Secreted effector protein pipB2 n=1 Tax=Gimesia maris TaxID=122 RepID=A0ABX5YT65_9PLAN|nr:toll/interleukin-1 receptor domain-containing protein [Gimesia maris]EDL56123.1 pentapeptide repeat family protein [Gimesia maris DSM 8797]QEG18954.1 Secreted effector protein pipB2 [Gimesia maris]QGQ28150.1 toll/interleukin-1 receptor domain-containing protein [Gimesia maris]